MIKLRNFFKSFGPKNVLRRLDLDIDSGEIVTIKGKNGSGKTTLLKALSTLEKPDDYDLAEIDGFDFFRGVFVPESSDSPDLGFAPAIMSSIWSVLSVSNSTKAFAIA